MNNNKHIRTGMVILLAIVLALTAACSKSADNTASSSSSTTTTVPQQTAASSAPVEEQDGPLTKYKEPVQATIYAITDSKMHKYIDGENPDDNYYTKLQKELLNIEFINKFTVDGSKVTDKVNLAIASDDIPDFTLVDASQLTRLIKNGQVEDLTEVYDKYASDVTKERFGVQNNVAFVPATSKDRIYGIPVPADYASDIPMMYIRTDWLKKLGLQPPKTLDELTTVAKAFVENDPDGNNKKDTIGISESKWVPGGQDYLLNAVAAANKAYPNEWISDASGQLVNGSIQPGMKDTLQLMQQWYKDGIIDPEFAVKEADKALADAAAGKVGIVMGVFWTPYLIQPTLTNVPGSDWGVYPIPTGADGTVVPPATPFTKSWIVVKKGYEHPEALVKSLNLLNDPGVAQRMYEDGQGKYKDVVSVMYGYTRPYLIDDPTKNQKTSELVLKVMETKDESILTTPNQKEVWAAIKNGDWIFTKIFTQSEVILKDYSKLQYSEFMGAPTATMVTKGSSLDKLQSQTFTKIIMGDPISDFDGFVTQWHKLGGDEIAKEVNDWYTNK